MCLWCMTHSAVALITTADGQSSAERTSDTWFPPQTPKPHIFFLCQFLLQLTSLIITNQQKTQKQKTQNNKSSLRVQISHEYQHPSQ